MAAEFSFDIVSQVDPQAVEDAVQTANKEMANRFDFKGSISRIEWDRKDFVLTLFSDDEYRLKSVLDILQSRLVKRGVPLKNLQYEKIESAEKGTVRQNVKIQQGLPSEKGKEIIKAIKNSGTKAQSTLQGTQVRVSSASKDALQAVIALLRSRDFGLELQFTNYR